MNLPMDELTGRLIIAGLCFTVPLAMVIINELINFLRGYPRHFRK